MKMLIVISFFVIYTIFPAAGQEQGNASWYGVPFHGRTTASGEAYDMHAMTAAHKSLPFGTRVRVTRTDNGSSVVVRINDRGPFIEGRIIDLSFAAASELNIVEQGVAEVLLETLPPEPDSPRVFSR